MKRIMTAIAVLLSCSAIVCSEAAGKNSKEEFRGYWDVYVRGGVAHTIGEAKFGELLSPAASIGFGYHITPVWGVRGDISGWQAKGASVVPSTVYKFNYLQANADVTIDICSIFAGYRSTRVLNPYLLAGVGANLRFGNGEAVEVLKNYYPGYVCDKPEVSPASRAGLGLGIRLSDLIGINIELNSNFLTDRFNSKPGSKVDVQTNALVGLNFSFGKAKSSCCSCDNSAVAAAEAAAASAAALAAAQQKAEKEAAEKAAAKAAEEKAAAARAAEAAAKAAKASVVTKQVDVFFKIGSWTVSQAEAAKIAELVDFLKNNPSATVTITGYADKDTGTSERNMYLSSQRAAAVGNVLMEAGISKDRIVVEYKGATVNPYEGAAKNRVAICVAK